MPNSTSDQSTPDINWFDPWTGWEQPRIASSTPGELRVAAQDNGFYLIPCIAAGGMSCPQARLAGLLDTGSTRSAISHRVATELGLTLGPSVPVKTAGGMVEGGTALLTMRLGEIQIVDWPVLVLPMSRNLLIGNDLLTKLRAKHLPDGTYYLQG